MPPRTGIALRHTIQFLKSKGKGIYEISKIVNKPYNTVKRWYDRKGAYDKARNFKSVTDRQVRQMRRDLNTNKSLRRTGLQHNCSHEFVRQKVRRSAANPHGLYPYKPTKILRLTALQKRKRVDYIKTMPYEQPNKLLNRMKSKVIFDQKPWELGKPPNVQTNRCWVESYDQVQEYPKDKHPTKIHTMAAISYYDRSKLDWYIEEGEHVRGICFVCIMSKSIFPAYFNCFGVCK